MRRFHATLGAALLCLTILLEVRADSNSSKGIAPEPFKLCGSVSISVSTQPDKVQAASNCTVINGHLMISIVNVGSSANYTNNALRAKARIYFPYLREVSEYVLLYRVSGLASLDHIFPKLSVIRGLKTLDDYSLVLFDVSHLTSIGLPWLRHVGGARGIRVDNSPMLCYLNTVHWSRVLGPRYASRMHFNHVQDQSQCSNPCPGEVTDVADGSSVRRAYKSHCPGRCWNKDHCQSLCNDSCGESGCRVDNTNLNGTCCHANCLAGCDGPANRNCVACRYFRFNDQCVTACPSGFLELDNWLCIPAEQCTVASLSRRRLGRRCVAECPVGHLSDGDDCKPCNGSAGGVSQTSCVKHCPAMLIRSAKDLKEARGCYSIDALVISLADDIPDLDSSLREAFANLTLIKQHLTVTQSRDLTSLNFLSNLRVIGGEHLINRTMELYSRHSQSTNSNVSLRVENTDFLQSLWNSTNSNDSRLLIARGGVLFNRNQRLCPRTVSDFVRNVLNVTDGFRRSDLGYNSAHEYNSNGNLALCIESTFNLTVVLSNASALLLHWPHFTIGDARYLLGYHVYYRLVPPNSPPVSYADPSTCEIRQWHTKFTQCNNEYSLGNTGNRLVPEYQPDGPYYCHLDGDCASCVGNCTDSARRHAGPAQCSYLIGGLSPASRYAVFVVPHIVRQMRIAAQSRLALASTEPDNPSPPDQLDGRPLGLDSILLDWRPPLHPNGNVTHYLVWMSEIPVQQESFALTDYCQKSFSPAEYQSAIVGASSTMSPSDSLSVEASMGPPNSTEIRSAGACPKCVCESEQSRQLKQMSDDVLFEDVVLASLLDGTELHMRPSDERAVVQQRIVGRQAIISHKNAHANQADDDNDDSGTVARRPLSLHALFNHSKISQLRILDFNRTATTASTPTAKAGDNFNNFDRQAMSMIGGTGDSLTDTSYEKFAELMTRGSGRCSPGCPRSIVQLARSSADNIRQLPNGYFIANATSFVARGLNYFVLYAFTVVACQGSPGRAKLCSHPARLMVRTLANRTADAVRNVSCQAESPGTVRLTWRRPSKPNGAVKYYEVDAQLASSASLQRSGPFACVSYQDWLGRGGRRNRRAVLTVENASVEDSRVGGIVLSNLAAGRYYVRVRAVTLLGRGDWSELSVVDVVGLAESHWLLSGLAPLLLSAAAATVFLICVVWWLRCRRCHQATIVTQNPDYWRFSYEPDEWEVPRDQVTYCSKDLIGHGSFGCVYRGVVRSLNTPAVRYIGRADDVQVAVKNVNEKASPRERHDFLREAVYMKNFRQCPHIVRLIGVVSENVPTLVLMELMDNGDLKNFLISMREDADVPERRPRPDLRRMAAWCAQIADGMYYMETKKHVHRDLAARNCMVAQDFSVKIGDFGMTRGVNQSDYYFKEGQEPMPVRWMAPEALRDGYFTTATDVWSYGVVIWEIASLAQRPFDSRSNEEVVNLIKSGKTLEPPDDSPEFMVKLMNRCWVQKPRQRASFANLLAYLEDLVSADFRRISWYHNRLQEQKTDESLVQQQRNGLDLLQQMTDKELSSFPMIRAPMNGYV